jgi:hypothetical protein
VICEACDKPGGGLYIIGCRDCSLRHIARGLHFWQSIREGKPTKTYACQCRALGKAKDVHAEVQATAAHLARPSA